MEEEELKKLRSSHSDLGSERVPLTRRVLPKAHEKWERQSDR